MDFVEFLKLALQKKKTVLIILIFGFITGIASYFIFPKVYETNVTFMVLESKLIRMSLEGKKLDIDTYTSLINNNTVMRNIYDSLNIKKKYSMPFEVFKEKFTVLSVENTAIIKTTIKFQNPKECINIANKLIEEVLALNKNVILKEAESGYSYSEKQVQLAKEALEKVRNQLKDFNEEYNLKQLALDIDVLKNKIAFHSLGNNVSYPIVEGVEISQTDKRYMQPAYILSLNKEKNNKSILELNRDILEIKSQLEIEKADNKKLQLNKKIKNLKLIKKKKEKLINDLKKKLNTLSKIYLEALNKNKSLNAEFVAAEEGLSVVYRNFVSAKTEVVGKTKEMTVIDYPVLPDEQVFPKLILNLIAGIFLGILVAIGYIIAIHLANQLQDD